MEDEVGIKKAHQLVEMLIEEEVKAGVPGHPVHLAALPLPSAGEIYVA